MKTRTLILILFTSLLAGTAAAQTGPFIKMNNGWQISNYNTPLDTVKDDLYDDLVNPASGWRNYYINGTPDNFIRLLLADSNTTAFSYNFLVKVTAWNSAGTQSTFNVTIPLSFDPMQYKTYRDVSVHRFKGAHKFFCNILSVTDAGTGSSVTFSNLKKRFRLQQVIQANRYEKSSYSEIIDTSDMSWSRPEPGKIKIDWSSTDVKSPTLFELEWMHADNYGGTYYDYLMDNTALHYDFANTTDSSTYGWYNARMTTFNISDNCLYFEDTAAMNVSVSTIPGHQYRLMARVKYISPGKRLQLVVFPYSNVTTPKIEEWETGEDLIINDFTATYNTTGIGFDAKNTGMICKIDDVYLVDITEAQDPDEPYYRPLSKLPYTFINNATRIRTAATDYTIEDVFENGYVLYRVRRVRPDSLNNAIERFSPWNQGAESGFAADYREKIKVGAHGNDSLNWNYQVSYAEEGKHKDVVGYYDGLLKPRQKVAVSNAEKTVIVGETKYDFNGRAAVQVLPVPAVRDDNDTLYYNRLAYYPAFNRNTHNKAYSASDFDSLRWICPTDTAGKLSKSWGASRYYSDSNPDKTGQQKYVPDAELYPMVHTEFMPDNTGRVRRQGGVGATHQLGGRHETFYDYSQPEQTELDRLFGSETGKFSHYKKQSVTDANGQVSVSYMDMQGRVVATALAGPSPQGLDSLDENSASRLMFSSLKDKNTRQNDELELTYEKTLVKDGPLYIDYRMQTSGFKDACLPVNLCFKCVYNYEITLINKECNDVVFSITDTIGILDANDTLCNNLVNIKLTKHLEFLKEIRSSIDTAQSMIIIPGLVKGTYALSKRLYVNPGAYAFYFDRYREKLNCATPFSTFFQRALDSTDFSGCDPCDTCETDDYGYCDAMFDLMKSDVSPGGQYCQFTTDANGRIIPVDTLLSVLQSANYRSIKNYTSKGITDRVLLANGTLDSVWKADVHTFVTNFKSSWSDSLVKFHPEYRFYEYCHDVLAESYTYDFKRQALNNYDSAYLKGYLNPTNITGLKIAYPYAAAGSDPYFDEYPALKPSMNSKMLRYKIQGDKVYSIWDMAATQAFCGQLGDAQEIYPCMEAFRNRKVVDSMYFNPALQLEFLQVFQTLYTSAKQVIIDSMMMNYAGGNILVLHPDKIRRYNSDYNGYSDGLARPDTDAGLASQIENMVNAVTGTDSSCYHNSVKWMTALAACPQMPAENDEERDEMRESLQDFCTAGRFRGDGGQLFAVTSISDSVSTPYHNIQRLLNYFFRADSNLALNNPACSRFLLSNMYEPGHHFTQEEAESKCNCVDGKILAAPTIKIQKEIADAFPKNCSKIKLDTTEFHKGLAGILNAFSAGSVYFKNAEVEMDSNLVPYKKHLKDFGYETFYSYEIKQTYAGGKKMHQWRINLSDKVDKGNRCNVFFNINPDISAQLFTNPGGTFDFSYTGDDSFQVNYRYSTGVARFKGLSKCAPVFIPECDGYTTDTIYGRPAIIDSTQLDSFMVLARKIRNGSVDSLMTEYLGGEGCVNDFNMAGNCGGPPASPTGNTLKDLLSVMNEAMYTGRAVPGKFSGVMEGRDEYYDATKINGTGPYVNYTLDSLSFTYSSKFAIDWNFANGYTFEGPGPNPTDVTDCFYNNNFASDPYFIGLSVFGVSPDPGNVTNCKLSYGAPYGAVPLSVIDTFVNLRIDPALRAWVADCYDFAAPAKKYTVTLYGSCFESPAFCDDFAVDSATQRYTRTYVEDGEQPFTYSFACQELDRFYSPQHDGSCPGSSSANDELLAMNFTPFFLQNLLNKKASVYDGVYGNDLAKPAASTFDTTGMPSAMENMMSEYGYRPEYMSDSLMIIYLGGAEELSGCQLSLRLLDGNGSFSFGGIDSFYNVRPDEQKLKEYYLAGNFENAGHYFILNAIKRSAPQQKYTLRGWLSCIPVYDCITAGTPPSRTVAVDNRCGCLTCPEVKNVVESFHAQYPGLTSNSLLYPDMLTRSLNNALNNNMSYEDYKDFIAQCRFNRGEDLKKSIAHLRVSAAFGIVYANMVLDRLGYLITLGYPVTYTMEQVPDNDPHNNDTFVIDIDFSRVPEISRFTARDMVISYVNLVPYTFVAVPDPVGPDLSITIGELSGCYAGFNTYLDDAVCERFGLAMPDQKEIKSYIPDFGNTIDTTSGKRYRWNLDLTGKNIAEKTEIYRVIDSALKYCAHTTYLTNFEVSKDNYRDSIIIRQYDTALINISQSVCESCNDVYDKIMKFQDEVWDKKPHYVREGILPEQIQNHLRNWYGFQTKVYEVQAENRAVLQVCATSAKGTDFSGILKRSGVLTGGHINLGHNAYPALVDTAAAAENAYLLSELSAMPSGIFIRLTLTQGSKRCGFTIQGDSALMGVDSVFAIEGFPDDPTRFTLVGGTNGKIIRYTGTSECHNLSSCCSFKKPAVCFRPYFETQAADTGACRRELTEQARSNAWYAYNQYTDSLKQAFAVNYSKACMDSAQRKEQVSIGSYFNEYHYTLYYYDLAGNLVKTVPPAGIDTLNITAAIALKLDSNRNNYQAGTHVHTGHKLGTTYRYNSLGQVRYQKTPDAGISNFYYDLLGRLVLSQNSKQAAQGNVYSYTLRDPLNRVTEVGEISSSAVNEDSLRFQFNTYFPAWMARGFRTQITRTIYDTSYSAAVNSLFAGGQQFLRSRVSSVAYFEYNTGSYSYATHYSYDIHGNVAVLVQDYPELQSMGNRYKYIHYDYDLVSGKVNLVRYQPGQPDRFYHRYSYDADNRLREVYTSSDSMIWDNDAAYSYYKHGPLARMELGGQQVQGVDYAYTIHGWLKGVNSGTLDSTRDMGKDGYTNTSFASDVYGFTLGYYNGDYKPIDNNYYNSAIAFMACLGSSPMAGNNLFNGNISHMVTAARPLMENNKPLATVYRYDQLNRITAMEVTSDVNTGTNVWNNTATSSTYLSTFGYDPNGNIKYLFRNGLSSIMDSLNYTYYPGTNKLKQVSDNVSSGTYPDDIDNQGANNYRYDNTGNLAKDVAEEIDTVLWNVYGKIRHIKRSSGSVKPGLEFRYDASGQRVVKIVKNDKSENSWTKQYYVRDAQGNVMATYNTRSYVANDALNIAAVSDWIDDNKSTDSLIALIRDKFGSNTEFLNLLNDRLVYNNKSTDVLEYYSLGEILAWNNALARDIAAGMGGQSTSDQQTFLDQLISYNKVSFMSTLSSCPYVNQPQLLNAFFADDVVLYNALTYLCNNGSRTSLEAICMMLGISYQACDPFPPFTCYPIDCSLLASNMVSYPDRNTLSTQLMSLPGFNLCMIAIGNSCSESEIYTPLDPAVSTYSFSALAGNIAQCMSEAILTGFFTGSYPNQPLAFEILVNVSDHTYLLSLAAADDAGLFIEYGISKSQPSLNEALAGLSGFDITRYMDMVRLRWGQPAYEDLASNMIYTQQLKLGQQHLYGSSRLGVKTIDTTLFQRDITINGFDSLGNMMVDDVLDSVKLQIDTVMYYNMLAQKQYELSNHLGNVIATVNDRKTPVIVSSALAGYRADVMSAQYYYPFGSPMPGKTFDASKQVVEEAVFTNTFASTTEDWEAYTPAAVPTQSSGRLRVQCNAVWAIIKKEINVVKGKPYILRFTIDMGTATSITVPVYDNTITTAVPNTQTITISGTYEYRFIANDDVMNILYEYKPGNPSSGVFYLDDISLLEEKLSYPYGFQGQEMEDDLYGEGNAAAYRYRISDNRLGRFLSIDPLEKDYPWNSPYAFSENRVTNSIELEGLEAVDLTGQQYNETRKLAESQGGDGFQAIKDQTKTEGQASLLTVKFLAVTTALLTAPTVGIPWAVSEILGIPAVIPSPQAYASAGAGMATAGTEATLTDDAANAGRAAGNGAPNAGAAMNNAMPAATTPTKAATTNIQAQAMEAGILSKTISVQKQARHVAGTAPPGKGYMNSVTDAQTVLNAVHSGEATFLGKSTAGNPVYRFDGVTGINVNVGKGIATQPTNTFMIKGTKSPSVVPTNPQF